MKLEEGLPILHIDQGIASVRLRRPSQRNSLCDADLLALLGFFEEINSDSSIRALVITSETADQKRPIFCAGYNVDGFESSHHDRRLFEKIPDAIEALRPITICALNGSVYGGGTDIMLACDLKIALAGSHFHMPACSLGLHYYPSGLRRFVANLGVNGAKRVFISGKAFSVEKLQIYGIFEEVVDSVNFEIAVTTLARKVADLSPIASQLTKQSLNELASGNFDLELLMKREAAAFASSDFLEGRMAMREKRKPNFRNH